MEISNPPLERTTLSPPLILPAHFWDLLKIWELEKACFDNDAWGLFELTLACLTPAVRLKALAGEQMVGFVMGEPRPAEGCAWIATIGVHPHFQRRGIGAQLLAAAEARLTEPIVKLTVRESNMGALALYEKFGYVAIRRWERYYSGGEAGIVMEKYRHL